MFPSPENTKKPFENLTAPEIRAAAKSSKKPTKAHQFWDPAHIHTSVEDRLAGFSFLNDPLTATVRGFKTNVITHSMVSQGEPLTNPTFDALCQSFYEDEKWQRALAISPEGDTEWVDSVTITMVSLAATSVRTLPKPILSLSNLITSTTMRLKNGKPVNTFRKLSKLRSLPERIYRSTNTSMPSSTTTKHQNRLLTASGHGQKKGAPPICQPPMHP